MVRAILAHNPPLEDAGNEFGATPMGWALHGSENGWHRTTGDYVGAVAALLEAGAKPPARITGTPALREALASRGIS